MNTLSRPWDDPRIAAGMKTQLARRRALLAAGEAPLGWKLGFGSAGGMVTDPAAVAEAIAGLGPAIELADMDVAPEPENVEAILAGDVFQRQVVLGPAAASRAGGKVAGLHVRALRNGVEVATTTDPEENIGKILDLVRHLADMLDAFGERLRAGEVIITGSAVPFIMIEPSDRSFAHKLDPIGEVSLRFSR
jgi:2-keto-4-pentenoate hydratase